MPWKGSAMRGCYERGALCAILLWPSVIAFWVAFCYGLLLWSSVVAFWLKVVFCYGLLVWPSVLAFWYNLLLWPSGWKAVSVKGAGLCQERHPTMVEKRVVCILLEFFLVSLSFLFPFLWSKWDNETEKRQDPLKYWDLIITIQEVCQTSLKTIHQPYLSEVFPLMVRHHNKSVFFSLLEYSKVIF